MAGKKVVNEGTGEEEIKSIINADTNELLTVNNVKIHNIHIHTAPGEEVEIDMDFIKGSTGEISVQSFKAYFENQLFTDEKLKDEENSKYSGSGILFGADGLQFERLGQEKYILVIERPQVSADIEGEGMLINTLRQKFVPLVGAEHVMLIQEGKDDREYRLKNAELHLKYNQNYIVEGIVEELIIYENQAMFWIWQTDVVLKDVHFKDIRKPESTPTDIPAPEPHQMQGLDRQQDPAPGVKQKIQWAQQQQEEEERKKAEQEEKEKNDKLATIFEDIDDLNDFSSISLILHGEEVIIDIVDGKIDLARIKLGIARAIHGNIISNFATIFSPGTVNFFRSILNLTGKLFIPLTEVQNRVFRSIAFGVGGLEFAHEMYQLLTENLDFEDVDGFNQLRLSGVTDEVMEIRNIAPDHQVVEDKVLVSDFLKHQLTGEQPESEEGDAGIAQLSWDELQAKLAKMSEDGPGLSVLEGMEIEGILGSWIPAFLQEWALSDLKVRVGIGNFDLDKTNKLVKEKTSDKLAEKGIQLDVGGKLDLYSTIDFGYKNKKSKLTEISDTELKIGELSLSYNKKEEK